MVMKHGHNMSQFNDVYAVGDLESMVKLINDLFLVDQSDRMSLIFTTVLRHIILSDAFLI